MSIALSGSLVISGSIFATQGITGSFSGSATSASYADTLGGLPSSSFAPAATFNTVSQSFATTSGSIAGRMTIVEGQDATTGSNTFTGVQYVSQASNAISFTSTASLYTDGGLRVAKDSFVSGTAYFNNITVYGTSSIEYITSSQVNIGSNIITVNTDTPAVRFGGLSVFDSGSTQLTGSLFWDSEKNHWIYSNPSGSSYNSAMLMNGPRNTGSLGDEQGTLSNYVMKGQGGDHITSSQIIDDGTTVRIPGNLQVTGSTILSSALTGTSAAFSGVNNSVTLNSTDAVYVTFQRSGTTYALIGTAGSSTDIISGAAAGDLAIRAQQKMQFSTGGDTPRMTITSTGNVGIGTTTPDVAGFGWTTLTIRGGTTAGSSGVIELQTPTTDTNGQNIGIMAFMDGTTRNAQIGVQRDSSTSTANMMFYTAAGSGIVERIKIASGGQVTIQSPTSGVALLSYGRPNEWTIQSEGSTVVGQSYGMYISAGSNSSDQSFSVNSYNKATNYFKVRGDGLVGIGASSPIGLLSLKAEVTNTPTLVFQNMSGGPSSAISNFTSAAQTFTVIGTNLYVNSTANLSRFDTSKESSGIAFDEGIMRFYTNTTSATAAQRMLITTVGNLEMRPITFSGVANNATQTVLSNMGKGTWLVSVANDVDSSDGYSAMLWVRTNEIIQMQVFRVDSMVFSYSNQDLRIQNTSGFTATLYVTAIRMAAS